MAEKASGGKKRALHQLNVQFLYNQTNIISLEEGQKIQEYTSTE